MHRFVCTTPLCYSLGMNMRIVGAIILFFVTLAGGIALWMIPAPESALPASEASGDRLLSEETVWYTITARYPAEPLPGESARANAAALSAIEAWVASTTAEFRSFSETLPEEEKARIAEMGRKYELSISYIPYSSPTTYSLEFDIYMDTGGAHPNTFFRTFMFDKSGNTLSTKDLFATSTPYLAMLSEESLTQVRAQAVERLGENTTLFEEGLEAKEENFTTIVIDGDSLLVLIPPYQAAAYAAGSFTVRIPFERIRDILHPDIAVE